MQKSLMSDLRFDTILIQLHPAIKDPRVMEIHLLWIWNIGSFKFFPCPWVCFRRHKSSSRPWTSVFMQQIITPKKRAFRSMFSPLALDLQTLIFLHQVKPLKAQVDQGLSSHLQSSYWFFLQHSNQESYNIKNVRTNVSREFNKHWQNCEYVK